MKSFVFLGLACLLVAPRLRADQTISFPPSKPVVDVTFPTLWELSSKGDALLAHPKDDTNCSIALGTLQATATEPQAAIDEAKREITTHFKNAKIEAPTSNDTGGLNVLFINAEGDDERGPASIHFVLIAKVGEKQIHFLKWVVPTKSVEHYAEAGAGVINSITIHRAPQQLQTYDYPNKEHALFTMSFPADWKIEPSNNGAFISAPDEQFSATVIAIDMGHITDATEGIGRTIDTRYKSCIWNEGGKPSTHIDKDTGMTLTTNTGLAMDEDGTKHRIGLYQFAKTGSDKFFIVSTWAPEASFQKHYEEIESMLSSIKHK